MAGTRRDTKGIIDAPQLMARVDFRRHPAAPALRPFVEHYWLIDWDLDEPFEQHVVPHPSVNIVFQHYSGHEPFGEIAGVGLELFSIKLEGRGRVSGVQFRPGGFRPFLKEPVASLTNHRVPVTPPVAGMAPFFGPSRVAALDAYLLGFEPEWDSLTAQAIGLVDEIRQDRGILRVADFARRHGMSVRQLQRLFAEYVGVGPKWVILRYRIHEALERAESDSDVDWAELAFDLGYSDQAHLVRDFTATIGVSPATYRRHLTRR